MVSNLLSGRDTHSLVHHTDVRELREGLIQSEMQNLSDLVRVHSSMYLQLDA